MRVSPQNSTIGILGGGQLARMLCQAAGDLGFRTLILCPEDAPPSAQFATQHLKNAYDDKGALEAFASQCDVITCEFESIPIHTLDIIEKTQTPVRPNAKAFATAQDRMAEKNHLNEIGIDTTAFVQIETIEDASFAFRSFGPGILKTRTLGYDGKGQFRIRKAQDLGAVDLSHHVDGWIYEAWQNFDVELSVILSRSVDGDMVSLPISTNKHEDGILRTCKIPAENIPQTTVDRAIEATKTLAVSLDYIGTLAVEFFVSPSGYLLANEFAPRVHNSGHWSRELCSLDQFTLHILAITGQPLPQPTLICPGMMTNLIGTDIDDTPKIVAQGHSLTLYGKTQTRPGRKMGHFVSFDGPNSRKKP